jgi:hypothetical protein
MFLVWNQNNVPLAYECIKSIGYHVNFSIAIDTGRKRPLYPTEKSGPQTTHMTILLFSNDADLTLGWFSNMVEEEGNLLFPYEVNFVMSSILFFQ